MAEKIIVPIEVALTGGPLQQRVEAYIREVVRDELEQSLLKELRQQGNIPVKRPGPSDYKRRVEECDG